MAKVLTDSRQLVYGAWDPRLRICGGLAGGDSAEF